jgi:hypothetical protein
MPATVHVDGVVLLDGEQGRANDTDILVEHIVNGARGTSQGGMQSSHTSTINKRAISIDKPMRKEGPKSNWFWSAIINVNSALGAGILAFPSAFDKAGGVVSATITLIVSRHTHPTQYNFYFR